MKKTIFIIITRSFIVRNILRSGTLSMLKKAGHNIVVIFSGDTIPEHIKKEFSSDQVTLVACTTNVGRIHKRETVFARYVINTKTTRLLAKYRQTTAKRLKDKNLPKPSFVVTSVRRVLLEFFSFFTFFRKAYRLLEKYMFPEKNETIQHYFDTYKPALVFSTSIVSKLDIAFMKEACRRKITTVSMPKSWDNASNQYYRFLPDYIFVQNNILKQYTINLQDIPEHRVVIVGFPQFDWYKQKDIIKTKKEHLAHKGMDPERAMIFFGSEGLWAPYDHVVAEKIYEWIRNDELVKPCQLLARPHYSNVHLDVFKKLRNKPHAVVDDYPVVPFFPDQWDPTIPNTIDFTNSVVHCDVMVNVASTLALDAACADRPIVSVGFGCGYKGGIDSTEVFYESDHNGWVMDTKAVIKPKSYAELKEAINTYLLNPQTLAKERVVLRDRLCYRVDGQSSKRIVRALHNILQS